MIRCELHATTLGGSDLFTLSVFDTNTGNMLSERGYRSLESAIDSAPDEARIIHCLDGDNNDLQLEKYHGSFSFGEDLLAHLKGGN